MQDTLPSIFPHYPDVLTVWFNERYWAYMTEGQAGEAWEPSNEAVHSCVFGRESDRKYFGIV